MKDEKQTAEESKPRISKKTVAQLMAERAYVLGKKFVSDFDVISIDSGYFKYKDGLWSEIQPREMLSWVNSEYVKHYEPTTKNQINEVIRNMEAETYVIYNEHLSRTKIRNLLNLKSKVLDLNNFTLKNYEREDFAFYQLPFDYSEKNDIQQAPNFLRFITSSLDFKKYDPENPASFKNLTDEEIKTMMFIQEWLGYSLVQGNRLHKNLIMIGEGRNGKGVFQEVWAAMLGEQNISKNDLSAINNTQTIGMTKNKLVNFSYDLEAGQQLDTGVVKSATSGETVMANEKYKDPYFFTFTAKLVIACNDLPYIKNSGFAIRERFYVLPFTRCFTEEERDPDLKEKIIKNEMEVIFNWAVTGLKRLLTRGHFDAPERCIISMQNYIMDNDTVQFWIEQEEMKADGDKNFVKGNVLYKYYREFCIDANYKPLSMGVFYKQLVSKGYQKTASDGYRGFKGLRKPTNAPNDAIL